MPKLRDGIDVARSLCFPPDLYWAALWQSVVDVASHRGEEVENVRQPILEGLLVVSGGVRPEGGQHPVGTFPGGPGFIQAHEIVGYRTRHTPEATMTTADVSQQLQRMRKSWQSLSRQDKTIALVRLDGLYAAVSEMDDSDALLVEINQLQGDIRLALGLEPPDEDEGLKV